MRTRQLALTGAAIAILASLAWGASPAFSVSRPACSAGRTIDISKSARVFVVTKASIRRVYGCSTSSRRVSYLGRRGDPGEGVDRVTVTGRRVAYVRNTACSDEACSETVVVYDLKARKQLSVAHATPGETLSVVRDIVLSTKGVVGWISEARDRENPNVLTAVYVAARQPGLFRATKVVPLATGLNISILSLALAGTTLYWETQGPTAANSAPLP